MFLLARESWLNVFLAGLVMVFFLWLSVSAVLTGAVPLGVGAGVVALAVLVFNVRKLRPPRGFLACFLTVFLLVFGAGTFITAILPESFASTARVKITPNTADTSGRSGRRAYPPLTIRI